MQWLWPIVYHWYNVQFLNIIENDKLSWEICSSKVALFCILPFYFRFEGGTRKYVTRGRIKIWVNGWTGTGQRIRRGFILFWQGKTTQSRWNLIVPILNSPSADHKVLEAMTTESQFTSTSSDVFYGHTLEIKWQDAKTATLELHISQDNLSFSIILINDIIQ